MRPYQPAVNTLADFVRVDVDVGLNLNSLPLQHFRALAGGASGSADHDLWVPRIVRLQPSGQKAGLAFVKVLC